MSGGRMHPLGVWLCGLALLSQLGCRAPGAAASDTIVLAIPSEIKSLDPAQGYDTYSSAVIHAIMPGLVDYDDGVKIVPDLAESWEVSDDERTYSFRLRSGVQFSSGRALKSADVKYAIERVLNPETASPGAQFFEVIEGAPAFRAGRAKNVRGIRLPDDEHVVFRLTEPSAVFLNVLAMTFAAPIPAESVGEDFDSRPIGAGSYRLDKWERGRSLELVATTAQPPHPRRIRIDLGVPEIVQMTRFDGRSLDVTSSVPAAELTRVRQDPRLSRLLQEAPMGQTWYIGMNLRKAPFTDERVRQAVNYAVDREKQVILAGAGQPAYSILPPGMPGYEPDFKPYPRDPARARQLLQEAGGEAGLSAVMLIGGDDSTRRRAQAVQADLREVGFDLELEELELTAFLDAYRKADTQCWYGGWYQDYPDPSNFLEVLFHSRNSRGESILNATRYRNADVDRLLELAGRMKAGPARLDLYRKAEEKIMSAAPLAPLYYPTDVHLRQADIVGSEPHPVWQYLRLANLARRTSGK